MGTDLFIVDYKSSLVERNYEFFEWLDNNFRHDEGYNHIIVSLKEFDEQVKELTDKQKKEWKEELEAMRFELRASDFEELEYCLDG